MTTDCHPAERILLRSLPCLLLAFVLAVGSMSCGGRYLQSPVLAADLQLRNTPQNQMIVELIEDYQIALEERNTARIRAMVSPRYHENAGTTDTTADDYGFDGLLELLTLIEQHVQEMQVELQIREVSHDERRNRASVIYEFGYTMRYRVEGQDMWDTGRDLNRLELKWENDRWWVIGGL